MTESECPVCLLDHCDPQIHAATLRHRKVQAEWLRNQMADPKTFKPKPSPVPKPKEHQNFPRAAMLPWNVVQQSPRLPQRPWGLPITQAQETKAPVIKKRKSQAKKKAVG